MTKETSNHDASVTQHQATGADAPVEKTQGTVPAGDKSAPPASGKGKPDDVAATAPAKESVRSGGVPPVPPKGPAAPQAKRGGGLSTGWVFALILVLVVVALGYGAWQQRQEFDSAGRELVSRLDSLERANEQTRREAQQALALAKAQDAKVQANDAALREARSQYLALEQAWQRFSNGADDHYLLDDVARALEIADQQLRLAGSVSNAVVALETAKARLAETDRPRFQALKLAVDNDLDRLRAVPVVDVPSMAARLHRLQELLANAPLLVPDEVAPRPVPLDAASGSHTADAADVQEALPADAPWWERWQQTATGWASELTDSIAQDLKGFVSVQRVGNPDALRLSPEQGAYLRNGVRTRLLTAQLALLMRQSAVWKTELEAVHSTVTEYYDGRSPDVVAALRNLDELLATNIAQPLPGLNDSLSALEALRAESRNADGRTEE